MLDLKTTISSLRRDAGFTQERLAQMLGVSVAAVSKWECGGAYPDITLLPQMAEIFGVSLDRLFGFDKWERVSVPEIIAEAEAAAGEGECDLAIEKLSCALARYPGNIPLTFHLARHRFMKAQRVTGAARDALFSEAEAGFSFVTEGEDAEYKGWAVHFLTTIAIIRGDLDTADRISAALLPPKGLYPRADRGVILMKRGDEAGVTEMRELMLGSIYEYTALTEWLVSHELGRGENAAALAECLRLISVLEEFEESGLFYEDLSIVHEDAALCLARMGDFEGCLVHLTDSAKYADLADTAPAPEMDVFGIMSKTIRTKNRMTVRESLKMALLSSERKEYDPLRGDSRFDALLAALD